MSQVMQEYVMDICLAYEEGYAIGEQNLSSSYNTYSVDTEKYYAWYYGHTNSLTNQMLQGDSDMDITFELETD